MSSSAGIWTLSHLDGSQVLSHLSYWTENIFQSMQKILTKCLLHGSLQLSCYHSWCVKNWDPRKAQGRIMSFLNWVELKFYVTKSSTYADFFKSVWCPVWNHFYLMYIICNFFKKYSNGNIILPFLTLSHTPQISESSFQIKVFHIIWSVGNGFNVV